VFCQNPNSQGIKVSGRRKEEGVWRNGNGRRGLKGKGWEEVAIGEGGRWERGRVDIEGVR